MKVIFTPFMILSNRVAQCAINLTMGCTAGSLTACRLRTSCYTKLLPYKNFLFERHKAEYNRYFASL